MHCYATRLTIGRVPNRLAWYYSVADRSSFIPSIYTQNSDKRIVVVKQRVLETSIRLRAVILSTQKGGICDHRRERLRDPSVVGVVSQRRQRTKSKGSQWQMRIQTECIERFREIKSRSLSQTNTSRNIIKSNRIIIINQLYHR